MSNLQNFQERSAKTRYAAKHKDLLSAMEVILRADGLSFSFTLGQLCSKAECSVPTYYNHFVSKEVIVAEAVLNIFNDFDHECYTYSVRHDTDPLLVLKCVLEALVLGNGRLVLAAAGRGLIVPNTKRSFRTDVIGFVESYLDILKERDMVRQDLDLNLIAEYHVDAMIGNAVNGKNEAAFACFAIDQILGSLCVGKNVGELVTV